METTLPQIQQIHPQVRMQKTGRLKNTLREMARHWIDYVCITPFFISFLVFFVYPLVWSLAISFTKYNPLRDFSTAKWVGLDNYTWVLKQPGFVATTKNLIVYLVTIVPLSLLLPLGLGVLLNLPFIKFRRIFITLIFLPSVTSMVVVGIVFSFLFSQHEFGWLNALIHALTGLGPYKWIQTPGLAYIPVITLAVWAMLGNNTLLMLGGLQAIDAELYEAAQIDGASGWSVFWRITLPLMRPMLFFLLVGAVMGTLLLFGPIMVLNSNLTTIPNTIGTPMTYVFGALGFGERIGYGSAASFLMAIVVIFFSMIQFRYLMNRFTETK